MRISDWSSDVCSSDLNTAVGSSFNVGGNANIQAENDVTLQGSELNAGGDVNVDAQNIICWPPKTRMSLRLPRTAPRSASWWITTIARAPTREIGRAHV